jgi:hypothetical protein
MNAVSLLIRVFAATELPPHAPCLKGGQGDGIPCCEGCVCTCGTDFPFVCECVSGGPVESLEPALGATPEVSLPLEPGT